MEFNKNKFFKEVKLLKQTSLVYLIFLITLLNVSALQADNSSTDSPSCQSSNPVSFSGMVKIGLSDIPEKESFSLEYSVKERAYLKLLERDILPYLKRKNRKAPTCFISYAWGDRYHEYWVKRFCEMLNKAGIQVMLDRWTIKKGNILNEFVRKIEEVDWVIVVGTKLYLEKYNKRTTDPKEKEHVARLEGQLIEYLVRHSTEKGNKVVPILLEGIPEESLPFMLRHKISSEFTKNDYFEELLRLIHDLYNIDNRDKYFEGIVEKFKRYAIAAGEHITEAEQKAYEEKRKEGIITLDKEIKEEIDVYKEEVFKLAEELAERGDYIEKELNLPTNSVFPRLHSYIPQAKLNGYVLRVKEQQELRQKLKKEGVCVVYGHGGVGKSTLAVQYGHNQKDQQAVWWMAAETGGKLVRSYENIAQELAIDYQQLVQTLKQKPNQYLPELARKIYNTLVDCQQPTLLILDNAEAPSLIAGCLLHRPSLVQIIITTRNKKDFEDYSQVRLDAFSYEEGKIYIQKRLPSLEPSEKEIEALIKEIGLIPQKLALATGYIKEIKSMNVEKYIHKLQELKKQDKKGKGRLMLPEVNLGLETLGLSAQLVMRYGTYLDPDFIPFSLVSALLGISDEEELDIILAVLERLSLIRIINDPSKQGIQIHREVQAACREYKNWKREQKNKVGEQSLVKSLLQTLVQCMPEITKEPDATWKQAELYFSNVTSVLASVPKELAIYPLLAILSDRMAVYSRELSCDYLVALTFHQQVLEIYQQIYKGENHLDIAKSLNNVGIVYKELGQYEEALKYSIQALEMVQSLYAGNHPEVANFLNYLGRVYYESEQPQEALKHYQQALEMVQSLYSGNHPEVANSLHGIGTAYHDLGQFKESLKYFQQALAMRQALYTGNHPLTANSIACLGNVYLRLGQYEEALKHHEAALKMKQSMYTYNHTYVAQSLNQLGLIYMKLGQYEEALKHYKQSLEMYQTLHSGNHPNIAISLDNIGLVYQALDQSQGALKYHHQALEMLQAVYSYNNPYTAHCLNSLGAAYKNLGQYEKALKYLEQSLKIMQGLHFSNHRFIADSLNTLGEVYQVLGKYELALEYYQQALKMRQDLYPDNPDHPDIQMVKGNIEKLEEEQRKAKP
ncbi:MAG: hypothetical protein BGO68_00795 [Candidatus Amoebophilus sp. 36-38]|nr:MAG: hypothetical protein BGO68_00795 [Candidatus Amoebophilus sp. 36-38]